MSALERPPDRRGTRPRLPCRRRRASPTVLGPLPAPGTHASATTGGRGAGPADHPAPRSRPCRLPPARTRGSAATHGTAPTRARTEATAAASGAPGGERRRDPRSVMVPYSGDQRPPASPPTGRTSDRASAPAGGGRTGPSRRPLLLGGRRPGRGRHRCRRRRRPRRRWRRRPLGRPRPPRTGARDPGWRSDTPATEAPTTTAGAGRAVRADRLGRARRRPVPGQLPGRRLRPAARRRARVAARPLLPRHAAARDGRDQRPPDTSDWDVTDESASFVTKYTPASRGDATQMCALVAERRPQRPPRPRPAPATASPCRAVGSCGRRRGRVCGYRPPTWPDGPTNFASTR